MKKSNKFYSRFVLVSLARFIPPHQQPDVPSERNVRFNKILVLGNGMLKGEVKLSIK